MRRFVSIVNAVKRNVIALCKWVATAIFGTQCIVMLLQIFMRRVVNRPFVWAEDLVVLLFVWLTYLGAAVLYGNGTLITVDLFVMALPKKIRAVASVLVDLIVAASSVYVLVQVMQFLDRQVRLGHKLGGALGLPSWTMTAALAISIASMVLSSLAFILDRIIEPHAAEQQEI